MDTGQIASKRHLIYEKSLRGLNSSEVKDLNNTPLPVDSSEYTL